MSCSYEDKREDYLGPSDGPAELFLSHFNHPDCYNVKAMNCVHCGHDIADLLRNTLHIGESCVLSLANFNTEVVPGTLRAHRSDFSSDSYSDM